MDNYYTTVPSIDLQQTSELSNDQSNNNQSAGTLNVGLGKKAFYVDQSGLWLGASTFAAAPFSVDMNGNLTANNVTASAFLTKTGVGQNLTGSINTGNGQVLMDGVNKRFIVNDGTNDRCLLGFLSGAF